MSTILWDLFVVVTLILPGAGIYLIDDLFGTFIYAFIHNVFHDNDKKLPVGEKRGIVVGKPTSKRIPQAFLVAGLAYYFFGYMYATIIVTKIFVFFMATICALVGFKLGPWFSHLYSKKDKALKVIDRIENGELNVAEETGKAAKKLASGAADVANAAVTGVSGKISDAWTEAVKHLSVKSVEATTPTVEQPTEPPAQLAKKVATEGQDSETSAVSTADLRESLRAYAAGEHISEKTE